MINLLFDLKKNQFLFEELVKRDFKQKYKRTVLGMGWSILSPLLTLLILAIVFGNFFGKQTPHFVIYMFCGNLLFHYYTESTKGGMNSLISNASIFTKVNVPKYLFLFSKNISALINFGLSMLVFFVFCIFDEINFGWHMIALAYPTLCIIVFNVGVGLILSALFVFYRDIGYLYDVFTMLVMYGSAIFYPISIVPKKYIFVFFMNPVYTYIHYYREVVIGESIPSIELHLLCAFYAFLAMAIGSYIYKKYNYKFLYYV